MPTITGDGALLLDAAQAAGAGVRTANGTSTLAAQPVSTTAVVGLSRSAAGALEAQDATITAATRRFRQGRGLNPINYTAINGVANPPVVVGQLPDGSDEIALRYPIGGSPLYDIQAIISYETTLLVRVYADGVLVHEFEPEDQVMFRLPSGFKAHRYQFELIGNSNVYSLAAAETARELMDV